MHMYGDIPQIVLSLLIDIELFMTNQWQFKNGNVQTCIDKVI